MGNRHRIILLFLILTLIGTFGCQSATTATSITNGPSETSATTTAGSEPTATESINNRPDAASGILRLWWSKRQTFNPLLDRSASGRDINDLVYQGLYTTDASQKFQPQIASQMTCTPDGLQVIISLQPEIKFHNGKQLTAADAAACLNFILANAAQSDFAPALKSVISAIAVDALNLQLTLNQADPWLPYALTFPIIPAASLTASSFALIPGSGPFAMASYENQKLLTLKKVTPTADQSELRTIFLYEYDNLSAAMQAFENDEIDMVNLAAAEYSRYLVRNSLRFEQYNGNQLLFIAYNTQRKALLSDGNRLLFFKQLFNTGPALALGDEIWGESTSIPLSAAAWMLQGAAVDRQDSLKNLGQANWALTSRKLQLLQLKDDSLQQKVMTAVMKRLNENGIAWQQVILPKLEYWAALQAGGYDLAVLETVLPEKPDPTWLYRDDRPADYSILGTITSGGLANYDLWRQQLVSAVSVASASLLPQGQAFADILKETAARSPWSVLQIRSAALLYGDRVTGQCQPDQYHPYRGIEELWIWSGQSS